MGASNVLWVPSGSGELFYVVAAVPGSHQQSDTVASAVWKQTLEVCCTAERAGGWSAMLWGHLGVRVEILFSRGAGPG